MRREGSWSAAVMSLALSAAACSTDKGRPEPGETVGVERAALSTGRGQLAVSTQRNGVGIFMVDAATGYPTAPAVDFFSAGNRVALGDLDGDGDDDFVVGTPLAGISFFEQAGAPLSFPGGGIQFTGNSVLWTGDVDNDGYDEVILGLRSTGTSAGSILVIARDGHDPGAMFNGSAQRPGFGGGDDFAVCDLNRDGYDEVIGAFGWNIYSHPSRSPIASSYFFGGSLPPFDPGDRVVCADFNGDGFDDIGVVRAALPGANGQGSFHFYTHPQAAPFQYAPPLGQPLFQRGDAIAAGDLTGDNRAEIVTGHLPDGSPFGQINAYDNQGRAINEKVFHQPGPLTFGSGDDVAIRRRHLEDTDGDGLPDLWEGSGPLDGIDGDGDGIPDFKLAGANPYRKDIFIEMDAMDCSVAGSQCADAPHHHEMAAAELQPLIEAFADAPVTNDCPAAVCPTGIALHLLQAERVPHVDQCCMDTVAANHPNQSDPPICTAQPSCFGSYRLQYFGTPAERAAGPAVVAAKALAYRYVLWGHEQPYLGGQPAGRSDGGVNVLMSLWESEANPNPNADDGFAVRALMHELGHGFGLDHGGQDGINGKPNYISVMNYSLAFRDLLDFSRAQLLDLYEAEGPPNTSTPDPNDTLFDGLEEPAGTGSLDPNLETVWFCPAPPGGGLAGPAQGAIDWNCNGVATDVGVIADITGDRVCIQTKDEFTPLASTEAATDQLRGGYIRAGTDGTLESGARCTGLDPLDEVMGNVVLPGPDDVLQTQICSDASDRYVRRIVAGAASPNGQLASSCSPSDTCVYWIVDTGNDGLQTQAIGDDQVVGNSIRPVTPDTSLQTPENTATNDRRLLVQIRPGPDNTLNSGRAASDGEENHLIEAGADGVLQAVSVQLGLTGDDTLVGTRANARVTAGPNAILETMAQPSDIVTGTYIIDGLDRVCDSELVGGDLPYVGQPRSQGQKQPSHLRGFNDWENIRYALIPTDVTGAVGSVVREPSVEAFRADLRKRSRADLAVTLSVNAPSVSRGAPVTFHVTLQNLGPSTAHTPVAMIRLPAAVDFASCAASGDCIVRGGAGSLSALELASGESLSADFVLETSCVTPAGAIAAAVQASSESTDVNAANDAATASTNVTGAAPAFRFVPADFTTSTCTNVALGHPKATDGCGGAVTITNNAPATFPLGRTVVTWTATGANGTAIATQAVTAILGDSTTCCPAGSNVIQGTSANDTLSGTAGADCILGKGAQDRINGNGGHDVIAGGAGDDILDGGSGNDRVFGGPGQDTLTGAAGDDLLEGGDGDDVCRAGLGNDTLSGGQGQDQLFGEDNDDTLRGDAGSDTVEGGSGNDYVEGGMGSDTCRGGVGTNVFVSCETKPDASGAPDACANGVKDNAETGVDCGGSGCFGCGTAGACSVGGDCLSLVCSANACLPPLSTLVPSLTITSDWGAGYCASVNALNAGATATTGWTVTIDTRQSTLYQTTQGTSSPATGTVTITPLPSQLAIAPNTMNSQVNICANRATGNTTALPALLASSVTY